MSKSKPRPAKGRGTAKAVPTSEPVRPRRRKTRIVAIGASAGGLEPIEQFFDATPEDTGLAYVIVQHLSPDFRSMMPELLKRHSSLEIRRIADGMMPEPNVIYLNPPRSSLEIVDGKFRLTEDDDPREFNLPINCFLESLAQSHGENAICIIMSGTGSDGTAGARAIATAKGVVLTQDPRTAKFESMPRSVAENVPGTYYAAPNELPELLRKIVAGEEIKRETPNLGIDYGSPEREIVRVLQGRYGLDFGYYKTTTVGRRIKRRAQLAGDKELDKYLDELIHNPEELEALYTDLLIGVTAFFRDRPAFDILANLVIPELVARMKKKEEIRIWVPGCASGEEVYSIAIQLAERARILKTQMRLKIFATDIHPRSLKTASRGIYPASALETVPEELRERYFSPVGEHFQLTRVLREQVVFSKHNLIKDPPFTRMDLVSCRNLLIYLDDEAQRKALAMFHFALQKDGVLFLGPSETLASLTEEFDVIDSRWRLFRKRRNVRLLEATRLLPMSTNQQPRYAKLKRSTQDEEEAGNDLQLTTATGIQRLARMRVYDAVLAKCVGTGVLVSRSGEIQHVFADAGKFLEFRAGNFSNKLADLVSEPLKVTVGAGLDRMRKAVDVDFVRSVKLNEGAANEVDIIVRVASVETSDPIDEAPLLVTFSEEKPTPAAVAQSSDPAQDATDDSDFLHKRVNELERDLRFSEETLQTTIEELETSNEELQATNEELQATNEELMAANEELQTVNEELHAVNEELYTVSSEHQSKIEELTSLTSDLDNLLQSIEIGVLFLDKDKNIRRVTPAVSETFNILARDVGRPIAHVTSRFEFTDLDDCVNRVIADSRVIERSIHAEGRDYLLRILPYRIAEKIDGAVLTFVDISDIARANRSLAQFANIVSHDLKAPLRAIRNSGEWIVEDLGDDADDEIKDHVARLTHHTDRLARMLTDLRDFSILGHDEESVGTVDVQAMLHDISTMFEDGQLKLDVDGTLPELETAIAPLRLTFQNLIVNAVQHNDLPTTTVKIGCEPAQDAAYTFSVTDDGPGIEPRHHAKIFLPFRKLQPSEPGSGSGIGLALVRKAIEDRGGSIEVRSDPKKGRGTTIRFTWFV